MGKKTIADALAAITPKREFIDKIIESEGYQMFKAFAITVLCFSFVFAVIYTANIFSAEVMSVFLGSFAAVFLILYRSFHRLNRLEKELKEEKKTMEIKESEIIYPYAKKVENLEKTAEHQEKEIHRLINEKHKVERKMDIFREFYVDVRNVFRQFKDKEVYVCVKKDNRYIPVSKKDGFSGTSNLGRWMQKRIDIIEEKTRQFD